MKCEKCDLCKISSVNCLPGEGTGSLGIMLIGDAVGSFEELYGKPFMGPAGQLLDEMLAKVGLKRQDLYLTNVVKCRPKTNIPGKETRPPTQKEVNACFDHLEEEIARLKPRVIVPLGNTALKRITGKISITSERGKFIQDEKYGLVFPTFHPAALLRNPHYAQLWLKDFTALKQFIDGSQVGPKETRYVFVDTLEKFNLVYDRMKSLNSFSVDIENTPGSFLDAKIISIGFSWQPYTGVSIPLLKKNDVGEPENWWGDKQVEIVDKLKELVQLPAHKILQNGSHDVKIIRKQWGVDLANYSFDIMLAHHLLDEEGDHDLDTFSWLYTDMGGYKRVIKQYLDKKSDSYLNIPPEVLAHYNAQDADCTYRCFLKMKDELVSEKVDWVFNNITMPLQRTLLETEYDGSNIDVELLNKLDVQFTKEIKESIEKFEQELSKFYKREMKVLLGKAKGKQPENTFNLNSTKQLQKLLFTDLKLPSFEKSLKTGLPKTDNKVLKQLKDKHVLVSLLFEYRQRFKIKSTYIDGFRKRMDEKGRVHTDYRVNGEVTGRIASRNPNLQNMPRKTDIRKLLIASPGCTLVAADMSQFELRVVASLANDQALLDAFKRGEDIHAAVTKDIMGVTEADPDFKEKRAIAKSISFGLVYGRGAFSLAKMFNMSEEKAEAYIASFFKKYQNVERWINGVKAYVQQTGYVSNIFGRKRRLNVNISDKKERSHRLRQAVNFEIQCLKKGTPVLTEFGYKPIELLNGMDKVWNGFEWANIEIFKPRNKILYKLDLENGHTLEASGDHEVFVTTDSEYSWKRVKDLVKGDIVVENPRQALKGVIPKFYFKKYAQAKVHPTLPSVDEDICYLIGVLLGDGSYSYSTNQITIAFGLKDKEYKDYIASLIFEKFNVKPVVSVVENEYGKHYSMVIYSRIVKDYFVKLGLKNEKTPDKVLPSWLLTAPLPLKTAVIAGLIDTDGHIRADLRGNTIAFTNCCFDVAYKYYLLLSSCGIQTTIQSYKNEGYWNLKKRKFYRVRIVGGDFELTRKILHLRMRRKADLLAQLPDKGKSLLPKFLSYDITQYIRQFKHLLTCKEKLILKVQAYKKNLSREKALRFLTRINDTKKEKFVDSLDKRYTRVKKVSCSNFEAEMYDIRVKAAFPGFIANNILVHNSSASDIVSLFTVQLVNDLKGYGVRLLSTIHDAFIFDVPKDRVDDVVKRIREVTSQTIKGLENVPLKSDITIGQRWGDVVVLDEVSESIVQREEVEDEETEE